MENEIEDAALVNLESLLCSQGVVHFDDMHILQNCELGGLGLEKQVLDGWKDGLEER